MNYPSTASPQPFPSPEREVLLSVKGVGPTVITRLEQLGFHSLKQLAGANATHIIESAAALLGSTCWKNSPQARAAIEAAIMAAAHAPKTRSAPPSVQKIEVTATALAPFQHLRNLGPKSAAMLVAAGIHTPAQLRALGSVRAFATVKASDATASLNLLWALEGAITGEPWQEVAREHRTSLLLALETHQRMGA